METNVKEPKQKKGFWAAIWESMTKTGGCCGSSRPDNGKEKNTTKQDAPASCCGK